MAFSEIRNAPNSSEMTRFRGTSSADGGFAKSARFYARISSAPNTGGRGLDGLQNDLTLLCEAAEFPGRGFMSVDMRYYGPNFKIPYQSTYEDLTLTFLVRDKFRERQFFDDWVNFINPVDTYNFRYRRDYTGTIDLFQMSDVGQTNTTTLNLGATDQRVISKSFTIKPQYQFTFEKAWPILVNPQQVTWADDNFHRIAVTFTYTRWYRKELDKINAPSVPELASPEALVTNGYTITQNHPQQIPEGDTTSTTGLPMGTIDPTVTGP